jgi:flagellum-specific peptidoglycan hydrolase FlgJ
MKNTPYTATIVKPSKFLLSHILTKVLLSGLLLIIFQYATAQSKYVKKFRPTADSLSAVYGVPASVILGVAIMESGSGTSRNCKLLKNHFGIVGKNNLLKTKGVKTRYKQYTDDLSSYVDFCRLMTKKKFYKRLKDNMDHKLWADAISKAGYSEIPEIWKQRLLAIIKNNKLSSSH